MIKAAEAPIIFCARGSTDLGKIPLSISILYATKPQAKAPSRIKTCAVNNRIYKTPISIM